MISIIVPNYNHESFLTERIESILNQSYQNFEVIILDDCSTDNSKNIIEKYRVHPKVSHIVYNEQNSGSTFKQWEKGLELAQGELVWIAESDDVAHIDFLKTLAPRLTENENCGLAYCNSRIIDDQGEMCDLDGIHVTPKELHERYSSDFINIGVDEIKNHMLPLNKIPNASAVLFRKSLVKTDFLRTDMKICGDWYFWISLLSDSDVSFCPSLLNSFRTHQSNVRTKVIDPNRVLKEYLQVLTLGITLSKPDQKIRKKLGDNLVFRYRNIPSHHELSVKMKIAVLRTIIRISGIYGVLLYLKSILFRRNRI
jgi:glycosyltransferase involved in cell wall biosynthesis